MLDMLHWHHINLYSFLLIQIYKTYSGEPISVVRKRAVSQNMRIHVHYDSDSIPKVSATVRNIIKARQCVLAQSSTSVIYLEDI